MATSCVGIASGIASLAARIGVFIGDVFDARKDLDNVRRELSSLELSLSMLSNEQCNVCFQSSPSLKKTISKVLSNLGDNIVEIEKTLGEMGEVKSTKRIKWVTTGK